MEHSLGPFCPGSASTEEVSLPAYRSLGCGISEWRNRHFIVKRLDICLSFLPSNLVIAAEERTITLPRQYILRRDRLGKRPGAGVHVRVGKFWDHPATRYKQCSPSQISICVLECCGQVQGFVIRLRIEERPSLPARRNEVYCYSHNQWQPTGSLASHQIPLRMPCSNLLNSQLTVLKWLRV